MSPAQVEAMGKWGVQQKGSYDYLKTIKRPTLVVNGNDASCPRRKLFHHAAEHAVCAADRLSRLQSAGAHHMYLLFVEHATLFLNA